jgi:Kef-type K+ transport system membrane component KefB
MRHAWTLVVLGLMMALFHRLTAAGPLEARATLTLGFLLLAAHVGGVLAKRVGLPRITGYLILGLLAGPWLGLVREDEVRAAGFISNAAVALIAFAAGCELKLEGLRREGRALVRATAGATSGPFLLVAAFVLAASPWFPLTAHEPLGDRLAIALVLGTIAAASSPMVTMALISELDARGPLARSVLSVTIAQDVALVALLSVVLGVARPLASAGAIHAGVAWTAFVHLAGSVGAGAVLGVLVAQYLKLISRDTALFLVALAFLTAEVARLLALDTMLIALAAGFTIENFSRVEGERLVAELRRGAGPVYVVFFAVAGAGLHLDALADVWPWVGALIALRAVGLRAGLRWAGRHPDVMPALARHGWLGLISQAGMALGLAITVRRAFPEWGVSLEALIVSMIAIHELVGPVCFRRALVLAGEVKEASNVQEQAAVARGAVAHPGGGV